MANVSPIQAPIPDADRTTVDPRIEDTLGRLINLCADGVEGHKRSAALVEDQVAKQLFEGWARERAEFLSGLQELGARHAVGEEEPGTTAGAVHRAWTTVIETISGDSAVIDAAATGEGVAMEAYEEALEIGLPAEVRKVVQHQYEQISEIRQRLINWETT